MKAQELRLGNYVLAELEDWTAGRVVGVTSVGDVFMDMDSVPYKIEDIRPIPLTSEWLLKFGFVDDVTVGVWFGPKFKGTDYRFTIWDKYGKEPYRYTRNDPDDAIDIHYVHTLQNLYFALSGEELTINTIEL